MSEGFTFNSELFKEICFFNKKVGEQKRANTCKRDSDNTSSKFQEKKFLDTFIAHSSYNHVNYFPVFQKIEDSAKFERFEKLLLFF